VRLRVSACSPLVENFGLFLSLLFVVLGNLENFGLAFVNKKQSSIFVIKPERINTAPMWFKEFGMQ